MPEQLLPNNPYARPVNATRAEGQMLQGEYYGQKAGDKALSHETGGRQVSPANRYAGVAAATPVDMDSPEPPKPKRGRPPGPKREKATIDSIAPLDEIDPPAVTEDDLFG
jgi:hypothetical protein